MRNNMATEVLVRGRVSQVLPQADIDGVRDGEPIRIGRYDEPYVLSPVRKQHVLLDERTYYVTNNAQTGSATPAVATFGATTPVAVIYNTDSTQNSNAKSIFLDYAALITTAAGSWASAGVNLQAMIYSDTGDRYT